MPSAPAQELLSAGRSQFEHCGAFRRALGNRFHLRLDPKYDGLVYVNEVIDCADRSVVGHCISKNAVHRRQFGHSRMRASSASVFLPRGDAGVVVRSDNGLVFASRLYRTASRVVRPPTGVHPSAYPRAERRGRSVSQNLQARVRVAAPIRARWRTDSTTVGPWIDHYNNRRPHSSLGYLSPAAWRERDQARITSLSV